MSTTFGPRTATFLERAQAGEVMIGTTLFSASPILTEVIAASGFDFLIVDTEHTPLSVDSTVFQSIVLAALLRDLPLIVRVSGEWSRSVQIALDSGATGVLLSGVQTAETSKRLLDATRFPPRGTRGACPVMRPTGYFGDWTAFRETSLARPLAGVLIEDPVGVANVEEILDTGVDLVWFGPFDYQVAAGIDAKAPEEREQMVNNALSTVASASRARGTVMAAVAWNPSSALDVMALGATLLVMTADLWLFHEHCRDTIRAVRESIKAETR